MATYTVTTLDDETAAATPILALEQADGIGLSLREAVALANFAGGSHTIEFSAGLANSILTLTNGEITLESDVNIDGDIDNDGVADITIDANNASRHLTISAGATNVTIEGLSLTEGSVVGNGGSIVVQGAVGVTIRNSAFSSNQITSDAGGQYSGGAIYSGGGIVRIYDTAFLNNSAVKAGNDANGGAISGQGSFYIYGAYFSSNSAGDNGGALNFVGGTHRIEDTVFYGNNAYDTQFGGGALYATLGASIDVSRSTFSNNSAADRGGAIFLKSTSALHLANSTFDGNSVAEYGGAIFADNSDAFLYNATFVGNSAFYGGAIVQQGISTYIDINNSTFTGNYASGSGGAIYAPGDADKLEITNSILIGNDAFVSGNDLFAGVGFTNTGGNIIGENIYAAGIDVGDVTLGDIFEILGNSAAGVYGGLLANNGGTVETVALKIGGEAIDAGDASVLPPDSLDLDNDANTTEDLPVDARGFQRVTGSAPDLGAVEAMQTFTVTTTDDETFDGGDISSETADGTGLSLREALALAQDGDTIEFDSSLLNGTITLTNGQLTITQDDLTINGDIAAMGDTNDITVDANLASRVFEIQGGSEADPNNVTLNGLTITEGYVSGAADQGGGVLINDDADVTISNSIITSNSAVGSEGSGGGVYIGGAGSLSLYGSTVSHNTATNYGGGIATASTTATVLISNSLVGYNEAGNGGGVYSRGNTTITNGSQIYTNEANTGGGIMSGGTLTVLDTEISNNSSTVSSGGGAHVTSSSSSIFSDVNFDGNTAAYNGGGLYVDFLSSATIVNAVFQGNSADSGGGLQNRGTLYLANSLLAGNTALTDRGHGGGLWNTRIAEIVNSTFVGNSAKYGGAIYQLPNNLSLEMDSTTITGNYATVSGGGIWNGASGAYFRITNSIVLGNDSAVNHNETTSASEFTLTGGNIIGSNIFAAGVDVGETSLADVFASLANNAGTGVYSGVLADNGGPVQTVMPNANGDAIDAGDSFLLPTDTLDLDGDGNLAENLPIDAREFDRVTGLSIDLGAVEAIQTLTVTTTDDQAYDGGDLASETADGGGLSLREALALAQDGDTIEFDAALIGSTINIGEGGSGAQLEITQDDIVIDGDTDGDGAGDITITAEGDNRVINIQGGSESNPQNVTLNGLTISDGFLTAGDGAGIHAGTDTDLTITNSTISNHAAFANSGSVEGGGIFLGSGTSALRIYNSTLTGNYALTGTFDASGGAIDAFGDVYLYDTDFIANGTGGGGGAIYVHSGNTLTISGGVFESNFATRGGAIQAQYGSTVDIENTNFTGNNTFGGDGGAIYTDSGNISVSNSTFTNNTAISDGGAISMEEGGDLSVVNSGFYNNTADSSGGAISHKSSGDFAAANSTFAGNSAEAGGGLYLRDTTVPLLTNVTLYGNDAGFGGGVFNNTTLLGIYNSTITGNYSGGGGGGLHSIGALGTYVQNTIFSGNSGYGGNHDVALYGGATLSADNNNIFGQVGLAGGSDIYNTNLATIFDEVAVNSYTGIYSGRLRDNGGPVSTVLILRGGIADGAGDATAPRF